MEREELRAAADRRLEERLGEGAADPRPPCRALLRRLRAHDPVAFAAAIERFEREVVPAVVAGADPLEVWHRYAQTLATALAPGRAVQLDASGRAHPFVPPLPPDALGLHLPEDPRQPALALVWPARWSRAQRAAYALLVGEGAPADR